MSWTVWIDDYLLYDPRLEDYKLTKAKLTLELNKADSFSCTVYPSHPNYSRLAKLKPTITVKNGDRIISKLRILDDKLGWNNEKEITAEGVLAWFNDSIQRPFKFPSDEAHAAPADYFSFLIGRHNADSARQVTLGSVTVTDPNNYIVRSDTQYSSTWTLMKEGLLNTLGGYIVPRYSGSTIYLDYLSDFNVLANQPVQFGLNMLDISTTRKGGDVATAILPLGAEDEETGERLTISDLPDSETSDICKDGDIVYSKTAESTYGSRIIKCVTWEDVTVASNLLTKATEELGEVRQMPSTVTLSAADLSAAGYNYNTFSLGTYVDVIDDKHPEHGLLARYLVKKLTIDLLNPAANKLTLGATIYSMTEGNTLRMEQTAKIIEANITKETARAIRELEHRSSSSLTQTEERIVAQVAEEYYTKDETNGLVSSVSSEITQTAEGINITLTTLGQDIDDVEAGADAKFEALQSYLRYQGGVVTLGESNSAITLTLENDRIAINVNNVPVTYWTADNFVSPFTLNIPVGGQLGLGNYAFIPRDNGSIDFRWVGN